MAMFPGMDKRAMEAAMRKLGVQQRDVQADEVVIKLKGGSTEIVISNPSVTKVTMMGQENFQIAGEYSERAQQSSSPQLQQPLFNEEDVKTVIGQTGCSDAEAKVALAKVNGDLAAAILFISEKR